MIGVAMNHGNPLAGDAYKVPRAEVALPPHLEELKLQIFPFINEPLNVLATSPRVYESTGVEQSTFVFLKTLDWLRLVVLQVCSYACLFNYYFSTPAARTRTPRPHSLPSFLLSQDAPIWMQKHPDLPLWEAPVFKTAAFGEFNNLVLQRVGVAADPMRDHRHVLTVIPGLLEKLTAQLANLTHKVTALEDERSQSRVSGEGRRGGREGGREFWIRHITMLAPMPPSFSPPYPPRPTAPWKLSCVPRPPTPRPLPLGRLAPGSSPWIPCAAFWATAWRRSTSWGGALETRT
jgi:hypothetical protein